MKSIFKLTTTSLIIMLALLVLTFACPSIAVAENTDLIIDLEKNELGKVTSKFDVYEDIIAYTSGKSLYIAKDNVILSRNNAFAGECLDLELTNKSVLLLYKNNSTTAVSYFTFDFDETKAISEPESYSKYDNSIALFKNNGHFFTVTKDTNSPYTFIYEFNKNSTVSKGNFTLTEANNISDFYIQFPADEHEQAYVYLVADNSLYFSINAAGTFPTDFTKISSLSNVSTIFSKDGKIYANTQKGIFVADQNKNDFKDEAKLSDNINADSKIIVSTINGSDYLFILKDLAILQYSITSNGLEYFNKFDNSAFVHPSDFNLIKAAKINEDTKVYSSPKNLQIKSSLASGDYIILLCKYDDPISNTSYYYVCTAANELGYIKADSNITDISANSDPNTLKIGLYAQGLHESTTIYMYPFSTSKELTKVDRFAQLIVINNVAQENSEHVWDYYKVSFVNNDEIITGYVKSTDVSPYCSLKPPQVLKNVKATTLSVGETVTIYALPSEDSPIVDNVIDGTSLELAVEYDENSEWTQIVYNDAFAYVKTASIQKDGLTSLQITVIVICCIVFVVTLIMTILIFRRKHFGY